MLHRRDADATAGALSSAGRRCYSFIGETPMLRLRRTRKARRASRTPKGSSLDAGPHNPCSLVLGCEVIFGALLNYPLKDRDVLGRVHSPAKSARRNVIPTFELTGLLHELSARKPGGLRFTFSGDGLTVSRDLGDHSAA